MGTSMEGVQDDVASDKLQQRQSLNAGVNASQSVQEVTDPIIPEKASEAELNPSFAASSSQVDMGTSGEGAADDVASNKLQQRQIPDTGVHASQSHQEAIMPSIIPEKASEDGYNWRKYGQKHVKGNEFIRSYYRCTHPNCQVKKQLERSHDGQITDIIYFGKHDHPKLQVDLPLAVGLVVPVQEERPKEPSSIVVEEKSLDGDGQTSCQIEPVDAPQPAIAVSDDCVDRALAVWSRTKDETDNDDDPDSKRQKKDINNVDATPTDKPSGEPRIVVQTVSEVDIVNDGYRWRKYGQKLVKGNTNPRSYYRCSNAGCPVKKHVERASHDPKMVITTYEGQHDHDMPPARTVTHNSAGTNTTTTDVNDESRAKSEQSDNVGLAIVPYICLGPENNKSNDQQTPSAEPVQT